MPVRSMTSQRLATTEAVADAVRISLGPKGMDKIIPDGKDHVVLLVWTPPHLTPPHVQNKTQTWPNGVHSYVKLTGLNSRISVDTNRHVDSRSSTKHSGIVRGR
ncbi:T-Complex Protein 1 Subunit Delta [Manis pentadactyla]|nr:T-Complex Protein 1 Subunit Delta [Manis pentadactyla]